MTSNPSSSPISLKDVSKTFLNAPTPTLKEISFDLVPGTLNAIIGPSGSGKSTLLHIIAGLDLPDSGSVKLFGSEITTKSEDERCYLRLSNIGQVFQFFHLLPALSAKSNCELPGVLLGNDSKKEISKRIDELFERFKISHRKDALPGELSGGEMQRVSLIRALCNSPKLLLADEPTGNLDSESGKNVHRMLRQSVDELGVTALIVTHDKTIADSADALFEIKDGVLTAGRTK